MKVLACILVAAALPVLHCAAPAARTDGAPDPQVLREMVFGRPAFAALSASDRQAMLSWITTRCAAAEAAPSAPLLQSRGALDLAFAEAYLLGPSRAERSRLAQTQRATGEAGDAKAALDAQSAAFRTAALEGLSLTATRRALPWLRRIEPTLQDEQARKRMQGLIRTVQAAPPHPEWTRLSLASGPQDRR